MNEVTGMRPLRQRPGWLGLMVLVLLAGRAGADGILVPMPPRPDEPATNIGNFTIKYHRVKLDIDNQVLTCSVDQVFHNETDRQLEGIYLFPAPQGAVVSGFSMEVDGKPLEGRLLSREEARSIYEGIVSKRRDPALLEYAGRDTFRARVFPIEPRGDKRIQIRYSQVLKLDNSVCEVVYPLNTEKFSAKPIEEVTVVADIRSNTPLATVYSPTHDLQIDKVDANHFIASYEENGTKPDIDFRLLYTVTDQEFGLNLLTYKPSAAQDGFFLLAAAPRRDVEEERTVPKDVVFVLDTSGSMKADGKIDQAKAALKFCVESLRDEDRFNVVSFSTAVNGLDGSLVSGPEARRRALEFIDRLGARGGTNMEQGLTTAFDSFSAGDRPKMVLLLSDGLPTVGQTDLPALLTMADQRTADAIRLFVFGVGYDVNTHFLDTLAEDNGGTVDYVRPKEDIELKVSSLFTKLANPVLTGLRLDFGPVTVYDYYPQRLPDLFRGSQLLLMGRYRDAASVPLKLTGRIGGAERTFEYDAVFTKDASSADFIPRLWAARKIGFLLDELRLNKPGNQELIDEVVALSKEYGIMTEYTSFLVEEGAAPMPVAGGMPGGVGGGRTVDELRAVAGARLGKAHEVDSGGYAVSQGTNNRALRAQAQAVRNTWVDAEGQTQVIEGVRYARNRAFYNQQGVWVDQAYRPQQHVLNVRNLSEAHFQLSRAMPELNDYLAMGENVVFVVNGQAVRIGAEGQEVFTDAELRALTGG